MGQNNSTQEQSSELAKPKNDSYNLLLKSFANYCHEICQPNNQTNDNKLLYRAAYLSTKIYEIDNQNNNSRKFYMEKDGTYILKHEDNRVCLVFKGIDLTDLTNLITNIGIIQFPIDIPNSPNKIMVHSGIYAMMKNHYQNIIDVLNDMRRAGKKIDEIIVCGHSLGGGLAQLFGLEYLLKNTNNFSNVNLKVITFGAPMVIGKSNCTDSQINQILDKLKEISFHYINGFDIIPRLLLSKEWSKDAIGHIIEANFGSDAMEFILMEANFFSLPDKVLNGYESCGNYFIWNGSKVVTVKNNDEINKILNFRPKSIFDLTLNEESQQISLTEDEWKNCNINILKSHKMQLYLSLLRRFR